MERYYIPLRVSPVPLPLDDSPGGPPLIVPGSDDPDPAVEPEPFLPDVSCLKVPFLMLFELVVPLRILSCLALESVGVIVVLLLSPVSADVLSPRLVAPAIAIGTARQNITAKDDTELSAFIKGRHVKAFSILRSPIVDKLLS
jgi:hypothetical protein